MLSVEKLTLNWISGSSLDKEAAEGVWMIWESGQKVNKTPNAWKMWNILFIFILFI